MARTLPGLQDTDARAVLDLAHQLAEAPVGARRGVAQRVLLDLLHAELCGFNSIDVVSGTAHVTLFPSPLPLPGTTMQVSEAMHDHPMIAHFARPGGALPCRVSDLVPRQVWLHTDAYRMVLAPVATDNVLAIPTRMAPDGGEAYALARSGPDFSLRDCAVATAVQAVLVALRTPATTARVVGLLTEREIQALGLLGEGLTAQAIAHRMNVSVRTVHKHLEHLYAKLNAHDRLTAVNRAREHGLL